MLKSEQVHDLPPGVLEWENRHQVAVLRAGPLRRLAGVGDLTCRSLDKVCNSPK
jgi:hypothetical protein